MNPGDLREKSQAELAKAASELKEQVFRLRFKKGAGELKDTSAIRKARCDLARTLTVIRERASG